MKEARELAELSQREVAERAGVSIDTVRRAENGSHEPGANALGAIAAALGVSVGSLYVIHDEPDSSTATNGHGENTSPAPRSHAMTGPGQRKGV